MTRLLAGGVTITRGAAALVRDVSIVAQSGDFIGLVGPNGAGKTTLLRALAGLEPLAQGAISIDGVALGLFSARQRACTIAYLPQQRETAWAISAEAVVSLGRFAYGAPMRLCPQDRDAIGRALAAADAGAFRSRTMTTLSGGEQARIHLARALAAETPVLLADEPTAALDPKHQRAIMNAMRERAGAGGIVIAALHDLALARRCCTRLVVLDRGAIVADGPPPAALASAIVEAVFGIAADDI